VVRAEPRALRGRYARATEADRRFGEPEETDIEEEGLLSDFLAGVVDTLPGEHIRERFEAEAGSSDAAEQMKLVVGAAVTVLAGVTTIALGGVGMLAWLEVVRRIRG
jgi:hypothetical protein